VLSFKYYIKTPDFTPECSLKVGKKVDDLNEKYEVAKFDASHLNFNEWQTISTTLDEDLSVIKFELYIAAGSDKDKTLVKIYLDNVVADTKPENDSFDFEDDFQVVYFESVNAEGHDMHVTFDIVSYTDAGLTAPDGCGEKLIKVTPTSDACSHLLFNIYNNFIIPTGSTVSFKLYIEAPEHANNRYIRYWDNEADDVKDLESGQWYDIEIDTTIDSGGDYIYIFLRNYDNENATQLNMYIDNLQITLPEA